MSGEKLKSLQKEREDVIAQIKSYPPPIPGCDEQFKWLLERRKELDLEISALSRLEVSDESDHVKR